MGFNTPTLEELQEQHWNDFNSRLSPVKSSPKYSTLKINSMVNAGMFHLLHENLKFLALQLFPDTAEGVYLDAHWSWRSDKRKLETFSVGPMTVTGVPGTSILAGDSWVVGDIYYVAQEETVVGGDGTAVVQIRALVAGEEADLDEGKTLEVSRPKAGLDDEAVSGGIAGGTDRESDPDYKNRMLLNLRIGTKYGKPGDWASWALDSSAEVVKAWEYPLSDSYGTLLIQVLAADYSQVADLVTVKAYIKSVAPPLLWDVETPEIVPFAMFLHVDDESEDTAENRAAAEAALALWMSENAKPGLTVSAGLLSTIASSPAGLTYVEITFPGDTPTFTIREFPVIGDQTWY